MVIVYLFDLIPKNMDESFMMEVLIIDLVSLLSFFFLRKENNRIIKKQYIRISYLFLIGFIIVHFQAYIDLLLGNLTPNNIFLWIDPTTVCKALVVSSTGFVCYLLGYSVNLKAVNVMKDIKPVYLKTMGLNILAFILLILFFATVNKEYLTGNYGAADIGSSAQLFAFIFEANIYAIIIINCRNLILTKQTNISFLQYFIHLRHTAFLLIIYLTAVIFSGDRGPIMYCSLAFVFGYIYVTKYKIAIPSLLVLLFSGMFFITVLGLIRQQDNNIELFDKITNVSSNSLDSYYPSSFSVGTKELAGSVRTVHLAVEKVPATLPHFYGLFFIQDAMLLVPMLKGAFISLFNIPKQFTDSPQFLTWADLGRFPTWGVGSSCIADTFLDFGYTGIIIVFFTFGYLSRKLELVAFSKVFPPIYLVILVFLVFSFSIYISRSTILYSLSKYTYVWLFTYLPFILKGYKKRSIR
ncbi:hypothetical protein MgSA37_02530 [Mucilaginibacter gotjawali]|nr:hypothetical protein MgSA37_02530 [Mucilaginibacter gotjawali]